MPKTLNRPDHGKSMKVLILDGNQHAERDSFDDVYQDAVNVLIQWEGVGDGTKREYPDLAKAMGKLEKSVG